MHNGIEFPQTCLNLHISTFLEKILILINLFAQKYLNILTQFVIASEEENRAKLLNHAANSYRLNIIKRILCNSRAFNLKGFPSSRRISRTPEIHLAPRCARGRTPGRHGFPEHASSLSRTGR